jgi:hypothetical protein
MSSFVRTLERAVKRQKNYMGRASQLGVTNPKAKDRIAREAREKRHANLAS